MKAVTPGTAPIAAVAAVRPDVIVVDMDREGSEDFLNAVSTSQAAILAVSMSADDEREMYLLYRGADQVFAKPLAADLLGARLSAAVRTKRKRDEPRPALYAYKGLIVDLNSPLISIEGEPFHLTATEYRLLQTLVLNAGRIMTHEQLMLEVWGEGYDDGHDLLRAYISTLRKVLKQAGVDDLIRTERQIGYWVPRADAPEEGVTAPLTDRALRSSRPLVVDLRLKRETLKAERDKLLVRTQALVNRAHELATTASKGMPERHD